jgi:uncharacterized membrane protein
VPIHPVQAALVAFMLPLYLGGLLADIAYTRSYQVQWVNFAAWLVAGAMVFTGFALLWALVELLRVDARRGRPLLSFVLLLALFVTGLVDSFVHARDAYGTMPQGLLLSILAFLLAAAITAIGFASLGRGAPR